MVMRRAAASSGEWAQHFFNLLLVKKIGGHFDDLDLIRLQFFVYNVPK